MYSVGRIARMFGVSRATLLYYDAVGLLPASQRSQAGYRLHTEEDRQTLAEIRQLRDLGVPVGRIKSYLQRREQGVTVILLQRILAINEHISALRDQQKAVLSLIEDEGLLKGAIGHRAQTGALARKAGITTSNYREVFRLFPAVPCAGVRVDSGLEMHHGVFGVRGGGEGRRIHHSAEAPPQGGVDPHHL